MTTEEFLKNHKISPDEINMEELTGFYLREMNNALDGQQSSLPMINSYCSTDFTITPGEPIIVIDAGGTNFRTCLVTFDEKMNPVVSDFKKRRMPGIGKEVTAKEFFSTIADEIERLFDKSDRIGFCFSYAATIMPDHDGYPIMFSKEIKAKEVLGKHLGKEILKEFTARGYDVSRKKIIILNDTVTTLLAGLTETEELGCEGCIGFILGTGTNTAYIQDGTIINVESGNLKISLGDIDREFLDSTEEPDRYNFEKMISGAYIGPGCLLVLRHAVEEGLFSDTFTLPETLITPDLSNYIKGEESSLKTDNEQDNQVLNLIARTFIERAGKLAAVNLAACIMKTEYGKNRPILINADGTTYYKTEGLKESTEKYLNGYLSEHGRKVVFTNIEQSPVIGSAIGALSI